MTTIKSDKKEKLTFFLYARKSSESEDRQIQSIEDQISRLKELASNLGISIKEILTESKTAKKPHCRPVFSGMLDRIEKGEAQGILCWQINRLSRNPVDSGTLGWMLQQGALKCIQTIDREYLPDDNVLLFNIETGQANQFIIDLRKNSRRGMEGKADRGWLPSRATLGYLNDKLEHTIYEDPERFQLVRKMWDLLFNRKLHTVPDTRNSEQGLGFSYSKNEETWWR
jgi:DNA invertase Pin-like site-specific DNA recombinase